jgi:hypothetical protein
VDEDAPRQIQGRFQPRQFPVEMLPDHEGESEQQDGLADMAGQEFPDARDVEAHVVVERVEPLRPEDGKPEDAGAARGEQRAVLDDRRAIQDQHRQAPGAEEIRDDLDQRFLLVAGGFAVEGDERRRLARRAGRRHRLEHGVRRHAPQFHFLEQPDGQEREIRDAGIRPQLEAQAIQHAAIGRAPVPVMARQLRQLRRQPRLLGRAVPGERRRFEHGRGGRSTPCSSSSALRVLTGFVLGDATGTRRAGTRRDSKPVFAAGKSSTSRARFRSVPRG